MKKAALAALTLCTATIVCGAAMAERPSELNRNAARFDAKMASVEGWLILEHEELAIWNEQADHNANRHPDRCVSVLVPRSMMPELKPFNRKRVKLTGVFHENVASLKPLVFFGLCNTTAVEILPGQLPEPISR